jgi:hypothetical protein
MQSNTTCNHDSSDDSRRDTIHDLGQFSSMKPFERLGDARTPSGAVIALYRHDGAYLILADGVELMSTRRHQSEDRLAEVACAPIKDVPGARVLKRKATTATLLLDRQSRF